MGTGCQVLPKSPAGVYLCKKLPLGVIIFEKNSKISVLRWWYLALSRARQTQAASLGQQ
jgi:hypothetical protein